LIAYVETNFILKLALQQRERAACETLLELAASGRVRLVVPACSLSEPYDTLGRHRQLRRELQQDFMRTLDQMERSEQFAARAESLRVEVTALLGASYDTERQSLDEVVRRVLDVAEVIPLTREVHAAALANRESRHLSPPDALVHASVVSHLSVAPAGAKAFLTRDADFDNPDIVAELEGNDCRLIGRFDQGLSFIRHVLGAERT